MRATARHVGRPRTEAQEVAAGGAEDVAELNLLVLARGRAALGTATRGGEAPDRVERPPPTCPRHEAGGAPARCELGARRAGAGLGTTRNQSAPVPRTPWRFRQRLLSLLSCAPVLAGIASRLSLLPSVRRTASQRPADSGAPVLAGAIQRPAAYGALGTIPDTRRRIPQNIHRSHATRRGWREYRPVRAEAAVGAGGDSAAARPRRDEASLSPPATVGGVNTARCAPKRPSARAGTALPHGLAAMRRACPRPPHRCSGTYTARRRAGVAPVALSGIGPPARRSTRRASLRLRRAGRLAGTAWTRARYSRAGVGSAASGTGKRRSATARARAWPPRRS